MNTFCPDDLPDCDTVPCAQCLELFPPISLNADWHCLHCEGAQTAKVPAQ